MAKALTLGYETYRAYENGARCMPPYVIADLVRLSGHGPWFVLTGEPDSSPPRRPGNGQSKRLNA